MGNRGVWTWTTTRSGQSCEAEMKHRALAVSCFIVVVLLCCGWGCRDSQQHDGEGGGEGGGVSVRMERPRAEADTLFQEASAAAETAPDTSGAGEEYVSATPGSTRLVPADPANRAVGGETPPSPQTLRSPPEEQQDSGSLWHRITTGGAVSLMEWGTLLGAFILVVALVAWAFSKPGVKRRLGRRKVAGDEEMPADDELVGGPTRQPGRRPADIEIKQTEEVGSPVGSPGGGDGAGVQGEGQLWGDAEAGDGASEPLTPLDQERQVSADLRSKLFATQQQLRSRKDEVEQLGQSLQSAEEQLKQASRSVERERLAHENTRSELDRRSEQLKLVAKRVDGTVRGALLEWSHEAALDLAGAVLKRRTSDPSEEVASRIVGVIASLHRIARETRWDILEQQLGTSSAGEHARRVLAALEPLQHVDRLEAKALGPILRLEPVESPPQFDVVRASDAEFASWFSREGLSRSHDRLSRELMQLLGLPRQASHESLKAMDDALRETLLHEALSNYFIGRMWLLRGSRPTGELAILEERILDLLKTFYRVTPQAISINMPFSDTDFQVDMTVESAKGERVEPNRIADVSRWGYEPLDPEQPKMKALVVIVGVSRH